jgi:peptide/nickel transport system substrate-binding protein
MSRDAGMRIGVASEEELSQLLTHHVTRRTALGIGFGAAVGLMTGCGGGGSDSSSAATDTRQQVENVKGGVLRIGRASLGGTAERLDPAPAVVNSYEYHQALYNRLVRLGEEGWDPVPDLALSWEPSADATAWTFELRRDVTWHDGKPFTSKDAAYMFRHILDPKTGSQQRAVLEPLVNARDIKTPDDHTLVVPLKVPHASFPSLLMNYNAYVIPDGSAATIGETGIGTGPFKLESFTPARNGRVVANPDYWDGPPNLDAIEFKTIQDTQARVNALLGGDVDFLSQTSLDFAQADVVKANPNTTVVELKNYFMYTIPMLVTAKPFDDLRVRQAFKLAYDPAEVLKLAAQDHGSVAYNNPVSLDDPNRIEVEQQVDQEKAKSLLRDAGYGDGLDVEIVTSAFDALFAPNALAFKDAVAGANIRVKVKQVPVDTFWSEHWQQVPLITSQFQVGRPLDQLFSELFTTGGGFNETKWSNRKFDQLVALSQKETDPARRKQHFQDAQVILMEDGGELVPYFGNTFRGMSRNVRNYSERGFDVDYKSMALVQG